MNVHRALGFGFLESVYANALAYKLRQINLTVVQQHPIKVLYESVTVGNFFADLLINDTVIVEIKAVEQLVKAHEVQLVNYLNACRLDTGLLINFGAPSLQIKRKFRFSKPIANTTPTQPFEL